MAAVGRGQPQCGTEASATRVTVTVPVGGISGVIAITTPGGTATSAANFAVVPKPKITLGLWGLSGGVMKLGRYVTISSR